MILIPLRPVRWPVAPLEPVPLIERWRMVTLLSGSLAFPEAMLMMIPVVPLARIEVMQQPSIVIDLVIVTAPKPPGSSASISPPMKVFEIAPANVLQGAVRLQGLASSPTPETQVLVACAWASEQKANVKHNTIKILRLGRKIVLIFGAPLNQSRKLLGLMGRSRRSDSKLHVKQFI